MSTQQTDEEIDAVTLEVLGYAALDKNTNETARLIARAVLAKWGQSAQAAEPVAWRVHPFDYGIGHEGVYAMTMCEEQREAWRRKGWNTEPLFAAPQPVAREPLTRQQLCEAFYSETACTLGGDVDFAENVCRVVEKAHGIKGGQHVE